MSNYPPGVTGNEFAIAGPDRDWETVCEECGAPAIGESFGFDWWTNCENGHHYDYEYEYGPDPDREYEELKAHKEDVGQDD